MNLDETKEKCAVIVSSCASYSDVWEPFFKLFFEYWPDCPFDVYLVTDRLVYEDNRVKTIMLSEGMGWPKDMRRALAQIDNPYFILFMEDFLLIDKVDTGRIMNLLRYVIDKKIDYLRLYPSPGPDKNFDKDIRVGEIDLEAPYRLSLMTALWRKDIFLELLMDEETIWQMELLGSERSRDPKYRFFSVFKDRPAVKYLPSTAIKKGVWRYEAVAFCKKKGILLDENVRRVEKRADYFRRRLRNLPILGKVIRRLI